jgi:hypothetical protein
MKIMERYVICRVWRCCNDRCSIATAVTARGSKEIKEYFYKLVAILHLLLQLQWRQWEYRQSTMSQHTSEFLVAHSTSEEGSTFFRP